MKIGDFSGGLNTRLSPRQLSTNQSTECVNVDFTSTDIVPVNGIGADLPFPGKTGNAFHEFAADIYTSTATHFDATNPHLPSFIEYEDDLYQLRRDRADGKATLYRLVQGTWVPAGFVRDMADVTALVQTNTSPEGIISYVPDSARVGTLQGPSVTVTGIDYLIPVAKAGNTAAWNNLVANTQYANTDINEVATYEDDKEYKEQVAPQRSQLTPGMFNILEFYFKAVSQEGPFEAVDNVRVELIHTESYKRREVIADASSPSGYSVVTSFIDTYTPTPFHDGVQQADEPGQSALIIDTPTTVTWGIAQNIYHPHYKEAVRDSVDTSVQHEYTYVVTLYSSATGFESSYIDEIVTLEAYEWDTVAITLNNVSAPAGYYDFYRIYRSGNGSTSPALLVELPLTSTAYTDTDLSTDRYLTAGRLFDTLAVGEVPTRITHGIEIANRIVLAEDNVLFASEVGNQDSFPLVNQIKFNSPITGVAESARGLLVFFKHKTYVIGLTSSGNYTKVLLSADQGCVTYRSIANIGVTPFWFSREGICTLSGNRVRVVSKPHLGILQENPLCAYTHDEKYYAVLSNTPNVTLVYDLRFGRQVPYYLELGEDVTNFAFLEGKFVAVVATQVREMFAGSPLTYRYTTGLLVEGAISEVKAWDDFYFVKLDSEQVTCTITDQQGDELAYGTSTAAPLVNLKTKTYKKRAYGVTLRFVGTSRLAEVEAKAQGRQNGR